MPYRSKIALIAILINFLCHSFAFANSYRDENIFLSKSTGIWENKNEYGYFKVIVYRVGLEHPVEKVRILVTKANTLKNTQEIIRDFELNSPGTKGYVNDISLSVVNNRLSVGLDITMKGMDSIVLREVFLIGIDGGIRLLSPAKYFDIYD